MIVIAVFLLCVLFIFVAFVPPEKVTPNPTVTQIVQKAGGIYGVVTENYTVQEVEVILQRDGYSVVDTTGLYKGLTTETPTTLTGSYAIQAQLQLEIPMLFAEGLIEFWNTVQRLIATNITNPSFTVSYPLTAFGSTAYYTISNRPLEGEVLDTVSLYDWVPTNYGVVCGDMERYGYVYAC